MGILKSINVNHFEAKVRKGWNRTYWFFDIHSTVIKPNYELGNIPTEFYPYAKEVLQMLTKLDDVCMVLYTCSHPHEIVEYIKMFEENNIHFDYINENPEVITEAEGCGYYEDKPYMNVLFEDKAGFDAETEWEQVRELLITKYDALTI